VKVVHVARNPMEAQLVAGFLRSRGIEAFVENESLWNVRGEVPMDAGSAPTVLVRDSDHARAVQLLGEHPPGGASRR
jgi:hypothetical protein